MTRRTAIGSLRAVVARLVKSSGGFTAAVITRAFFQWLIIVVLAKLGGPEEVGAFTALLAIASPSIIFFEFGYRNVYASQATVPNARVAVISRIILLILASAVIVTVGSLYGGIDVELLLAISCTKSLESILDLTFLADQRIGKMGYPALAIAGNASIGFVAFALARFLGADLAVAILAMGGPSLILLVATSASFRSKLQNNDELNSDELGLRWLVRSGFPTGLAQALSSFSAYLPIYALTAGGHIQEAGQYAVLSYFLVISQLIMGSMQQVRLSGARALANLPLTAFKKASIENALIALPISLLSLFAVKYALTPVYGEAFSASWLDAILVAVSIAFLPISYGTSTAMLILGMFNRQLLVTFATLALGSVGLISFFFLPPLTCALIIMVFTVAARAAVGYFAIISRATQLEVEHEQRGLL